MWTKGNRPLLELDFRVFAQAPSLSVGGHRGWALPVSVPQTTELNDLRVFLGTAESGTQQWHSWERLMMKLVCSGVVNVDTVPGAGRRGRWWTTGHSPGYSVAGPLAQGWWHWSDHHPQGYASIRAQNGKIQTEAEVREGTRCGVVQLLGHVRLCFPTYCSTPGSSALHHLPPFAQTPVCWVSDAIQSSHPLSPLFFLPSVFPSIRVFSSEWALLIRWSKYWSFSFSISLSNEYWGLISFRIDWFDLQHNSKASILGCSGAQPSLWSIKSHLYMTTGRAIALTI